MIKKKQIYNFHLYLKRYKFKSGFDGGLKKKKKWVNSVCLFNGSDQGTVESGFLMWFVYNTLSQWPGQTRPGKNYVVVERSF